MAAHVKPRLTPEEYLEFERAAEFRHEYFNGEIFVMHATSARHSLIIFNLARELGNELKSCNWSLMGQSARMTAPPSGLYCYPDLLVVSGEISLNDDPGDIVSKPTLVIEVISPSTEAYDRGFKSAQYRKVESLREYALVSQDRAHVEIWRRLNSGQWLLSDFTGLDAECVFESVACHVALAEIYRDVMLDD